MTFREQLMDYASRTEAALDAALPLRDCPQKEVVEALRYSLLGGGKRLRAALLLAFYQVCGGEGEKALPFASALEMVHAYSLIHDDLPCMDDDDLRRGKPSCHIAFGEATALLAGDALLTHAFDHMLHADMEPQRLLAAAGCLSRAIGVYGMIGGQVMDLSNESSPDITEQRLKDTDALKTGALICAACEMGCILAGASEEKRTAAKEYAAKIGLAFQITDDILDQCSTTEELGKPVGSDEESKKATYASLYGIEEARRISAELLTQAKESLRAARMDSPFLLDMADYILERKH
ncbi:MAG: polyprenyl synthetase family protein [Oscillospiraceae bacterium]|nr:polyprenyl synthetase family protein [Oscillospiraceae bacterium]